MRLENIYSEIIKMFCFLSFKKLTYWREHQVGHYTLKPLSRPPARNEKLRKIVFESFLRVF
jgi:hypothetical protein